jgi:hypothetical protein
MDEKSTGRMVIPPGITSTWTLTRNPPEEYFYTGKYKLMDQECTRGIVIPSGITIAHGC